MALALAESLDYLTTAELPGIFESVTGGTIGAYGRGGSQGIRFADVFGTSYAVLNLYQHDWFSSDGAYWIVGLAVKPSALVQGKFLGYYSGSTEQVSLRLETDGNVSAFRGATLLGTSAVGLQANTYSYLEFYVKLSSSTGIARVRINEGTVLNLTGINTLGAGGLSAADNKFRFGGVANTMTMDYDDLTVVTPSVSGTGQQADFLGNTRVLCQRPIANGSVQQWDTRPTPGGNHLAAIDETTPNDSTDYIVDQNVGTTDLFTFDPLPVGTEGIFGVHVKARTRLGNLSFATLDVAMKHGGSTYYNSLPQFSSSSWFYQGRAYDTFPTTSTAITSGDIAADEFGLRLNSEL